MLYRWHVKDPVYFDEDFKMTIDNLGWTGPRYDDYTSVAYWYQTEPKPVPFTLPEDKELTWNKRGRHIEKSFGRRIFGAYRLDMGRGNLYCLRHEPCKRLVNAAGAVFLDYLRGRLELAAGACGYRYAHWACDFGERVFYER